MLSNIAELVSSLAAGLLKVPYILATSFSRSKPSEDMAKESPPPGFPPVCAMGYIGLDISIPR